MFEYFDGNYPWNLAVNSALNGGGVMGEIDEACRPLRAHAGTGGPDAAQAWGEHWGGMARRLATLAGKDEAAGRRRSAGHRMRRAAVYNLVAERNMRGGDPERAETYKRALHDFRRAVELLDEPMEFVEVPYKDTSLPALFVPAKAPTEGGGRAPCMIHFDGLDVTKELLALRGIATELRERGIATLLVDHPGVGEALRLRGLTLFPETEVPAAACVDYLQTRPDVDAGRVGLMAVSLGGYYAPRAAAFEKRLACCVAWGAIWDYGAISEGRARRTGTVASVSDWADQMRWVFGTATVEEALAVTRRMTLDGVIERVTCPILVVHGEGDRQIPLTDAVRTYEGAVNSARRELKVFGADEGGVEHCQADNVGVGMDFMADWVADVLGAPPVRADPPG